MTIHQRPMATCRRSTLPIVVAVWLSFLAVSLCSAPIPAVNEPHYLAKARHFWDAGWCAGDLFLESYPAHQVFYAVVGWLTLILDFTTVAIVGRIVVNGLLAASWVSLIGRLHCRNGDADLQSVSSWTVLLSAWLFVGLQALGNFSGEWLIGGFESKTISYSLVFWSVTAMIDERWHRAALLAGLATSFHPIIGLWHLVAIGVAEVTRRPSLFWPRWPVSAIGLWLLASMAGLWPAVQMLRIASPRDAYAANFIQVYARLKHHLDPMDFRVSAYVMYVFLTIVVVMGVVAERRHGSLSVGRRWWVGYLMAMLLFAIGGFLAGVGPRPADLMPGFRWRMVLLKFYPFRMFDLLMPLTVAVMLPCWWSLWRSRFSIGTDRWIARGVWAFGGSALLWAVMAHQVWPPSNQLPANMRADWLDVCRWVATNTPPDTVFHTPFEAEAFKWFAQRAEYVNNKDCPQDAAGLVEWNRRQRLIKKWSDASFLDDEEYSADELRELVRKTNVTWAITRTRVRYDADLLYRNDTYKILRLPEAAVPNGSDTP